MLHRLDANPEIGECAPLLTREQPHLGQLLEVIADGGLGKAKLIRELTHANRLTARSQQDVQDPKPMSIAKNPKQALQLSRIAVG